MNAEDFMEAHANDFPVLANTYMMSDYVNEFHAAMEAYHRAKVEGMTDERIISMAHQISLNKPTRDKVIFLAGIKQGAMALRDKLLNQ